MKQPQDALLVGPGYYPPARRDKPYHGSFYRDCHVPYLLEFSAATHLILQDRLNPWLAGKTALLRISTLISRAKGVAEKAVMLQKQINARFAPLNWS
jgi:hypothetical protein